jgi:hypothetical protein
LKNETAEEVGARVTTVIGMFIGSVVITVLSYLCMCWALMYSYNASISPLYHVQKVNFTESFYALALFAILGIVMGYWYKD